MPRSRASMVWLHPVLFIIAFAAETRSEYLIGLGKADITGPAADVNLMGYANPGQIAAGIHTRLYSRAYIFADEQDESKRFVFINTDACMAAQGVTIAVRTKLKALYKGLYTEQNIAISGIHTHSGPGGYLQYVLYDITSLGFVRQSYDALVNGIVESVSRAHVDLKKGRLEIASGELLDANINRSPTSYLKNPLEERAKYRHDIDKEMSIVKFFDSATEKGLGLVSWFPVHCTSINNTNSLISGDNKGVAAQLTEKWATSQADEISSGSFVAAFAQANVGDTSPNTQGAFCADTGKPCSADQSLCNGRNEMCIGRGPAYDADDHGFQSNLIIATKQFQKAKDLWKSNGTSLSGGIDYRHKFLDMSNIIVKKSNYTRAGKTCPAAMGFSFAAGTTDGPGAFDFKQGDTNGTLFWKVVGRFLKNPAQEQIDCQAPKPILLDTGEASLPYAWQPSIVDIQILRIGQLVILCVPGELTTMAGRRLREAVHAKVSASGIRGLRVVIAGLSGTYAGYVTTWEEYQEQRFEAAATAFGPGTLDAYIQVAAVWGGESRVVIAGLSNTYSSYVTTREEYGAQRYEGASTIFGPSTLDAYIQSLEVGMSYRGCLQEFLQLADEMLEGKDVVPGPSPPDLISKQLSFLPGVIVDWAPSGVSFGSVVRDVASKPFQARSTVVAEFQSACPRNNLRTEGTFLAVELQKKDGSWETVHTDDDISTKFYWRRPSMLSPESTATITWEIPEDTSPGTYRLRHFGDYKHILGGTTGFTGTSSTFTVESRQAKFLSLRNYLHSFASRLYRKVFR